MWPFIILTQLLALMSSVIFYWFFQPKQRLAKAGLFLSIFIINNVFLLYGLSEFWRERFHVYREQQAKFFPGALETIQAFRELGVKLALVTNGAAEPQRAKVERFNLAPLFDHVQIEGEAGFGKPQEQAYVHAMQILGVQPHETWMVGDNLEWEVAAPQRLGIYAIWHDHLGEGLPPGSSVRPDRIVQSIAELNPRARD